MKLLFLICIIVLFNFPSQGSEVVNLKLSCVGKLSVYKGGALHGADDGFRSTVTITNNVWDNKNQIKLEISDDFIFRKIEYAPGKLALVFNLNRYTGELWYFQNETYTGTEYRINFDGNCERMKSRKF